MEFPDQPKVKIRAEGLTKIFGPHPERALEMLDSGVGKDEIMRKTKHGVGLYDASFEVYEGEILVIMGLSGSGKSTLIRHLNRLIEPTKGKVLIDDVDIMTLKHKEMLELRRRKFGMVFQNFALFPHRTVLGNTYYGLEVRGVSPEEREGKAREALKLVGLEGWEDSRPAQLSGGMQQRVGLARALTVDPDILLMDEAFSALDPLIRRDMQHELIALQARVKKTIVFITHDLDEALKLGDRIVLMKDGSIIQIGTGEDILTRPADEYVQRFVEDVDKSKVLTAGTIMSKARVVTYPNEGLHVAMHKMREETISSIFVVNRDYTLVGYLEAKKARDGVQRGKVKVKELMNTDVRSVPLDEPISSMFGLLAESGSPLPVVDEDNVMRGVIVRGVLLGALADQEVELPEDEYVI
jgi:glycine betaine/proline transport system ATP-binding protein